MFTPLNCVSTAQGIQPGRHAMKCGRILLLDCPPPEYVILRKLEYYREGESEKHLRAIASMMELSSAQIKLEELQNKIQKYSLEKEWKQAQKLVKWDKE